MRAAVFFDIDGTILDHNNYIPPSTVEGIHRLQEAGNYAFLCTGRTRAYVRLKELLDIGFDGIVSGCGTMIEFQGELLHYQSIDNRQVARTVDYLRRQRAAVIMEGRHYLYLDPPDFKDDPYLARLQGEIGEYLQPINGNEQNWEVSKFSCATAGADMEQIKRELEKDYELLIHDVPVLEIVPKGCSKGTGILKVCELLDIPVSDTYAIGDSANDLPMFLTAGHSIAMGNGTKMIKEAASFVTDDLHEDGIYHGLEHYGLI